MEEDKKIEKDEGEQKENIKTTEERVNQGQADKMDMEDNIDLDDNTSSTDKVKIGSTVSIVYKGTLDDGSVFDKVEDKDKPFRFKVGSKQVIKKFEDSLIGMKKGDRRKLHINSTEAYGPRNDALLLQVPKSFLEGKVEVKPGKHIMLTAPDGSNAYALIKEVKGDNVVLDLNHPLAGKDLNFDIEVVDVQN